MGLNLAFSMLKSTPAGKNYTTAGCVVGTNISYEEDFVKSDGNGSFFHVDQSDKYPSVEDDRIVYQVYIMI